MYYIKIKKEYASAVLEDLQQSEAIEIVEIPVPEWQQAETGKRLHEMKETPANTIPHEDFVKILQADED